MNKQFLKKLCAGAYIALLAGIFLGCAEKDLFDPNHEKNQPRPIDEYFGFELRGDVKLNIDYKAPGYRAHFQIFSENPIAVPGTLKLKEGIQPIYSAFTTTEGKFEGTMKIPTAVKEVWLYTNRIGISGCVEMSLANGMATYSASTVARAGTRVTNTELQNWFSTAVFPYDITQMPTAADPYYEGFRVGGESMMYSICKWGEDGKIMGIGNDDNVTIEDNLTTASGTYDIAGITERAGNYLKGMPFGQGEGERGGLLIKNPMDINVVTTENETQLSVTFLDEAAMFKNGFGYYYYPKSSSLYNDPSNIYEHLKKTKKYIVFPNASKAGHDGSLAQNTTVKLKYFDDNNKQGTVNFPKDYVVGWFLLSGGFDVRSSYANTIMDGRPSGQNNINWGTVLTSNDMKIGSIDFRHFISMVDNKTGSIVVGVEDVVPANGKPDYDYCDLTFMVTANKALATSDKPVIPEKMEPEVDTTKGTIAFEDMWPENGDYDLNDVVVEYERVITYDENNFATSAEEKFIFKQDINAATNDNFFAYTAKLGTFTELSEGLTYETETNSLVIKLAAKNNLQKLFTIKRTFSSGTTHKDQVINDFDPYLIIGNDFSSGRKEVHLPKHSPTKLADSSLTLTGQDVFYIDFETGLYPFAIDIPIHGYKQVTERSRIDSENEYPAFKTWAVSHGTTDTDWYKTGKGGK